MRRSRGEELLTVDISLGERKQHGAHMRPHHAQHAQGSYKDRAHVGRIWLKTPALT